MIFKNIQADYLRSTLFGIEDGLVSTTGAVVGISVGAHDSKLVILAGLVIIAVEAISMAAGQFLSEQAVHELEAKKHQHHDSIIRGALIMFVSYFVAGLIPVLPFILLPIGPATGLALLAAFISLFLLGYFKAKITQVSTFKSGAKTLLIGGFATAIGVLVGTLLKV